MPRCPHAAEFLIPLARDTLLIDVTGANDPWGDSGLTAGDRSHSMADFWSNTLADLLGSLFAGFVLVVVYVVIQWFLTVTDIEIGYAWKFHGSIEQPQVLAPRFEIRNRSRSRTYYVANVAYMKEEKPIAHFDNDSIWDTELKPGTITIISAAPIKPFSALKECLDAEVHVRLQTGRLFWLQGSGPGQQRRGHIQRAAFWLRAKLEEGAIPTE